MPAPTGFTLITATKIMDASAHQLLGGRITFFPVSTLNGRAISAIAGGGGGMITQTAVPFLVVDGVITTDLYGNPAQLADTTLTTPANIAYRVTVTDASGQPVQGPGYGLVQPSGPTWSLDTYVPVQPTQVTVQPGLQGVQGPEGPAGSVLPLIDSVTGEIYTFSVASGVLSITASGGTAKILQDASTGGLVALTIAGGAITTTPISSTTAPVATIVLIDSVTEQLWQLGFANGSLSETVVGSSGSAVASVSFIDTVTHATVTLTFVNGSLAFSS